MHTLVKTFLALILIASPSLALAAEAPPAAAPAHPAVTAPAVIPASPATAVTVPATTIPTAAAAVPSDAASTAQTTHIGYVDINRIGTESDHGKAIKALLSTRKDKLQGKLEIRKKQIEKLKASIEAKIALMSPQQREAKSREFQKKVEDFQKFARASEEELYALQDKETKALYDEIEKAAVAYGTAKKLAVVVVKKELLYIGSTVEAQDVTEELIKSLNLTSQKR